MNERKRRAAEETGKMSKRKINQIEISQWT